MCKGSDSHGGPAAGAAAARVAARSCRRGGCSTRWGGGEVDLTITEPTKKYCIPQPPSSAQAHLRPKTVSLARPRPSSMPMALRAQFLVSGWLFVGCHEPTGDPQGTGAARRRGADVPTQTHVASPPSPPQAGAGRRLAFTSLRSRGAGPGGHIQAPWARRLACLSACLRPSAPRTPRR
jgi:hypothetical protein